jgi:hypothetical protein
VGIQCFSTTTVYRLQKSLCDLVRDGSIVQYFKFDIPMKLVKGKSIPVTGCGGPQGCEMSRFSHFLDSQLTDGCEVVDLMHQSPFTPGRFLVFISIRGQVDPKASVLLEGLKKLNSIV